MSKVIFIDVDGTLVSYENILPVSAVEAIRAARKNLHKVYICTGRSRAEVYQNIWDIGLDGMVGGNGAYVEADGKVIFHQHITVEQCKKIVDWLNARHLEFYLESNAGLFASKNFEQRGASTIKEYSARKNNPDAENMTVRKLFPEMIFDAENFYRDDVNKISFILDSYEDFLQAKEKFPEMKVGTWGGAGDTALFGEFGIKNLSKVQGIVEILKYLGADRESTIAFGDSKWDLAMFEYCAVSVAMGDGGDVAKAAATFVTDAVEEDGLKNAFVKLNLI